MVDVASGEGAGVIGVLRMGPPGTGLVGYGVLPAFRGRGFTTRALRLVSRWAFEEAGLARLELGHKVGNVASGKAAARAGFRVEGRLSADCPTPTAPGPTRSTTPWSPTTARARRPRPDPGQTLARKSSTRCCTSAAASGS